MKWEAKAVFTLDDLFVAYRKAKVDSFYERTQPSAIAFAEYEKNLPENIDSLLSRLNDPTDHWYEDPHFLGTYGYVPKDLKIPPSGDQNAAIHFNTCDALEDWQRLFENSQEPFEATFRLIIKPTVDFHVVSALWILKVGHKFEARLNPKISFGNRLRRKSSQTVFGQKRLGAVDFDIGGLFEPYFSAYHKWRQLGLKEMRTRLLEGESIIALTMDLKKFYHQIDREFLLERGFLAKIGVALSPFEEIFTGRLLKAMFVWAAKTPEHRDSPHIGLPVGLSASKIIANILLFEFDELINRELSPYYYGRYVDDVFLVLKNSESLHSGAQVLKWLASKLSPRVVFEQAGAKNVTEARLVLRLPYAGDSVLVFAGEKLKIFPLKGETGLDLVGQISAQIAKQSSERRMLPVWSEDEATITSNSLLATTDEALEVDALRKADAISLRRLGFSILLANAEAHGRDLPPSEWARMRSRFAGLVERHVLTPKGFFDYASWIHRAFGLLIESGDYTAANGFLNRFEAIVDCLRETTTIKNSRADLEKFELCLQGSTEYLLQVAYQAATIENFKITDEFHALLKRLTDKLPTRTEGSGLGEVKSIVRQLLICDLGARPYKNFWRTQDAPALGFWLEQMLPVVQTRLRANELRLFCQHAGFKSPCTGAIFPTRPFLLLEITELAPSLLESPKDLSEALYALRGVKLDKSMLPKFVKKNQLGTQTHPRNELVLPESPEQILQFLFPNEEGVSVAVTSWLTDETEWKNAAEGKASLTLQRYERLNRLINRILEENPRPDFIVLPELSLPRLWAGGIAKKLASRGISLIAGLEYHRVGQIVHNEVLLSLATTLVGYGGTITIKQAKLKPSYEEAAELKKLGVRLASPPNPPRDRPIYVNNEFCFGVLICSDLTDIRNRAHFQGYVDCLFVVEWNQDLPTFGFLVESAAHDIHSFVVQANNRKYGDSRIRAPFSKEYLRDMVRVRGGVNDYYVIGKLNYLNLRKFQSVFPPDPEGEFKPYPIGFKLSDRRKHNMPQRSFLVGQKYTRKEIKMALGGSDIEFLPTVGGRVVCGCFTLDHNPEAPDIIIPGTGPVIESASKIFCGQDYPVPIFIKRRPNEWEYVGRYKAERYSTDRAVIASHHMGSITALSKVTRVIFLKRKDD